jgi:hypothetical protein
MVSVEASGNSAWRVAWMTLHVIWDSEYTVGMAEHVIDVFSAEEPRELDELRYDEIDEEQAEAN